MDEIGESELIKSIHPDNNRHQIFKTNQGDKGGEGGSSGSFFFFT